MPADPDPSPALGSPGSGGRGAPAPLGSWPARHPSLGAAGTGALAGNVPHPPASSAGVRPHPAPVPTPLPADPPQAGPKVERRPPRSWLFGCSLSLRVPAGAGLGEPLPAALSHRCAPGALQRARQGGQSQHTARLEIKIATRNRSQTSRSARQPPSPTPWIWDGSSGSLWLCVRFPGFKSEPEEILT